MTIINVSNSIGVTSAGTCNQSIATINITSSTALAANANRKKLLVLNPPSSANTIFLSFGSTATTASGLPLAPGQGWTEESSVVYTGVFSAITATGTASLLCFEWA